MLHVCTQSPKQTQICTAQILIEAFWGVVCFLFGGVVFLNQDWPIVKPTTCARHVSASFALAFDYTLH